MFLKPKLPADEWKAERERMARKKPHLSLVNGDPRPDPDLYRWHSLSELIPIKEG